MTYRCYFLGEDGKIDRRDDVDYLRRKAAQFRKLASEQATPLSAKMAEIADALERHAAEIETRTPLAKQPLSSYRVYFRTSGGAIAGREDFKAEGDWSALMIATVLCDACADVCTSFELWDGVRRVDKEPRRAPDFTAAQLRQQAEETVIEREIAMRDSHWLVAKSQRLLGRIRQITEGSGAGC